MMTDSEFVVIGGGPMGSAAAMHIAKAGRSVTMIHVPESQLRASHSDAGRITRGIDPSPCWAALGLRSVACYREIERASGIAFFNECGCVLVGETDGLFLAQTKRTARTLGIAHDLLDPDALGTSHSCFQFPKGTSGVAQGLGAGTIDPRGYVKAMASIALRHGARIVEDAVTDLDEQSDMVTLTLATGHQVRARQVVLAAGPYVGGLSETVGMQVMPTARTIVLARLDESEVSRLSNMPAAILVAPGQERDVYILPPLRYRDGHHYLKIGGDPTDVRLTCTAAVNDWFMGDGSEIARDHLTRTLFTMMPDLNPQALSARPCVTTPTKDGLPLIARLTQRLSVLSGGNGGAAKSGGEIGRRGAEIAMGSA
jgi:sarcosine oxidase